MLSPVTASIGLVNIGNGAEIKLSTEVRIGEIASLGSSGFEYSTMTGDLSRVDWDILNSLCIEVSETISYICTMYGFRDRTSTLMGKIYRNGSEVVS